MTSHPATVIVLAHPELEKSRINAALASAVRNLNTVEVRDLFALYPDHAIDVEREKRALAAADEIVLQYATHWYSMPGLMKQWLDNVMVRGWAYGTGTPGALAGKTLRVVTSTGGTEEAYRPGGFHGWTDADLLAPIDATRPQVAPDLG
jgi:putative NADPH-quinone reductase